MRKTIKSLEIQINDLRELRQHDLRDLQRTRQAEHEAKQEKDRLLTIINDLKGDKQFLKNLCAELSSALKIRS